jgi:hypothetical protein
MNKLLQTISLIFLFSAGCVQNGLVDEEHTFSVVIEKIEPAETGTIGGETINVIGQNFDPGVELFLDAQVIEHMRLSSSVLTFVAPVHTKGPVDLKVSLPDGRQGGCQDCLQYIQLPMQIDEISPMRGPSTGGTEVTISGKYLPYQAGVLFDDQSATVISANPWQIKVIAPEHGLGPATLTIVDQDDQSFKTDIPNGYRYRASHLSFQDSIPIIPPEEEQPEKIYTVDANNDGLDDLVLFFNCDSNHHRDMQVRLSQGDGSFVMVDEKQVFWGNQYSFDGNVSFCDWTNDGIVDILISSYISPYRDVGLYYMEGLGDGSFDIPVEHPMDMAAFNMNYSTIWSRSQHCGDFNGDGFTDFAIIDETLPTDLMQISFGNQDGDQKDQISIEHENLGSYFSRIIGDFDQDGADDIIMMSDANNHMFSDSLLTLVHELQTGSPRISSQLIVYSDFSDKQRMSPIIGDFNQDECLDVAFLDNNIVMFLGNGFGEFDEQVVAFSNYNDSHMPMQSRVSDFFVSRQASQKGQQYPAPIEGYAEGDPEKTMIWTLSKNYTLYGKVSWYGFFVPDGRSGYYSPDEMKRILVLDSNGDESADYIWHSTTQGVSLAYNLEPGKPASAFDEKTSHPKVVDLDQDGLNDLVGLKQGPDFYVGLRTMKNVGSKFEILQDFDFPDDYQYMFPAAIQTGDFNSDGHLDALLVFREDNVNGSMRIARYFGIGDGLLQEPVFQEPELEEPNTFLGDAPSPRCDINGDGILDYIGVDYQGWPVLIRLGYANRDVGELIEFYIGNYLPCLPTGSAPSCKQYPFFEDVDADGICEIIYYNDNRVAVFHYNNGSFTMDEPFELPGKIEPIRMEGTIRLVEDFNHDSYPDLLVSAENEATLLQLYIFPNDGQGGFSEYTQIAFALEPDVFFETGNFDGDGFTDLAIIDPILYTDDPRDPKYTLHQIQIFSGLGDGRFTQEHPAMLSNLPSQFRYRLADFDGNGLDEFLALDMSHYLTLIGNNAH